MVKTDDLRPLREAKAALDKLENRAQAQRQMVYELVAKAHPEHSHKELAEATGWTDHRIRQIVYRKREQANGKR